jgi:hypothetical protein
MVPSGQMALQHQPVVQRFSVHHEVLVLYTAGNDASIAVSDGVSAGHFAVGQHTNSHPGFGYGVVPARTAADGAAARVMDA